MNYMYCNCVHIHTIVCIYEYVYINILTHVTCLDPIFHLESRKFYSLRNLRKSQGILQILMTAASPMRQKKLPYVSTVHKEKPINTFKVLRAFPDHIVRCILFTRVRNSYIDFTFFLPLVSYNFHCKESVVLVLYIILKYLPIIRKSSIKYEYCSVLFILHLSLFVYIHKKNRK